MDRIGQRWPVYALYAPWLLLVIGVLVEVTTPEQVSAGPLLALACVTAGAITSFRTTVWVSVTALIAELLTDNWQGGDSAQDIVEGVYIALAGVIGLDLNRLLARYGSRLRAVTTLAETVQRVLLPPPPPELAGFGIAAEYRAAQAEALIGGDLYAVQDTPHGLRILVGDVRGKGMGAVSTVSLLLGAFRERAHEVATLQELADRLEAGLEREAQRRGGLVALEGFTTAVLAEIPPEGGRVRLLNCGHPPPYAVTSDGMRRLDPEVPDLPLGLRVSVPDRSAPTEFDFPAGSSLLFVTDGVTEARNADGVFFDPLAEPSLTAATAPAEVLRDLVARVDIWSGGRAADDMAILAIGH